MKEIVWKQDTLAEFEVKEIGDELKVKKQKNIERNYELAVEQDDAVMDKYLEGNEPEIDTLKTCIRKGTLKGVFAPTLWFCIQE